MTGKKKRGKAVRGFVRGILWGSLAAAGGLVVVSQLAGPAPESVANLPDAPAAAVDAPVKVANDAEAQAPVADDSTADTAPAETATPEAAADPAADAPVTDPAASEAPDANAPKPDAVTEAPTSPEAAPATSAPDVTATPEVPASAPMAADAPASPAPEAAVQQPAAPVEPPKAPPSDAPKAAMAATGADAQPVAPAVAPDLPEASAPAAPGLPEGEAAPQSAELPPPPPLTPEEEALLMPLPEAPAEPAPSTSEAAPDPTPEPGPIAEAVEPPPAEPAPAPATGPVAQAEGAATLAPEPGLQDQAEGVVTGRLPRIGDAPAEADAPVAEALPELTDPALDESLPPLQRYARPFANAAQKPLFAILLEDDGQDGVNRADLAALDLPLTIVIDPLSDGAAERAAIWRTGGQEVVMAGTGIPDGASPGDLEQSFQVLSTRLPEAVAVIDPDGAAFQNNRPLASQVVPILAAQGRGLVTFDQGLNAADQVARRENLAATTIFRRIDGEGEASPVIQRYLDRAAFKAAQEGRVVVIGDLRAETVAGILEWAVEGRASTVALAPITALLAR